MAGETAIIAKAKADLEASGQQWETSCDAYRITNLAAQRTPGWQVVEKTSGDNCQGRKVDGIIANGNLYDVLVGAGPPNNENKPSWQLVGPQNALVGKDPYPWPDPANRPQPEPEPEPNPDADEVLRKLEQLTRLVLTMDAKIDALAIQSDTNTKKIQTQIHDLVEDLEESMKEYAPLLICRYNAGSGTPAGISTIFSGLFGRSKAKAK